MSTHLRLSHMLICFDKQCAQSIPIDNVQSHATVTGVMRITPVTSVDKCHGLMSYEHWWAT